MSDSKRVLLMGGPNGAGKTTAAMKLLPESFSIFEFVNADEISRGLNPLRPEAQPLAAGRIMLERMDELMQAGKNFAFETTCAGLGHVEFLRRCNVLGYNTSVMFLWLSGPELALQRVAERVRRGGHSIPPEVIQRRYKKGIENFIAHYLPVTSGAMIYDNSDYTAPVMVAEKQNSNLIIHAPAQWKKIQESAGL